MANLFKPSLKNTLFIDFYKKSNRLQHNQDTHPKANLKQVQYEGFIQDKVGEF